MDTERVLRGLRSYAIPSAIVGIVTFIICAYAMFIAENAGSEEMNSVVRRAVVGAALVQAFLVFILLIPGTHELRNASRNVIGRSVQRPDNHFFQRFFTWWAIGYSGVIFVFLFAFMGVFATSVFNDDLSTIALTIGGFVLYVSVCGFLVFLPMIRMQSFTKT